MRCFELKVRFLIELLDWMLGRGDAIRLGLGVGQKLGGVGGHKRLKSVRVPLLECRHRLVINLNQTLPADDIVDCRLSIVSIILIVVKEHLLRRNISASDLQATLISTLNHTTGLFSLFLTICCEENLFLLSSC